MKLYHGTESDNIDSINESGLCPTDCGNKSVDPTIQTLQGKGYYGIYGFTNLSDAKDFTNDNGCDGAVYEFDADDNLIVDDPEYSAENYLDGKAVFVQTDTPICANLIWTRWER